MFLEIEGAPTLLEHEDVLHFEFEEAQMPVFSISRKGKSMIFVTESGGSNKFSALFQGKTPYDFKMFCRILAACCGLLAVIDPQEQKPGLFRCKFLMKGLEESSMKLRPNTSPDATGE